MASKVPDDIAIRFRKHAKETPGQNLKTNLACAAKLWNSLPIDLQAYLLANMKQKSLYPAIKSFLQKEIAENFVSKISPDQEKMIVALSEKMKL